MEKEFEEAKAQDILLSLHLKAAMMKISDPILFGYCMKIFFKDLFTKHTETFREFGINANLGFGGVSAKIKKPPSTEKGRNPEGHRRVLCQSPKAMVDWNRGITNLHVPSDLIIDAPMPSMIRGLDGLGGGKWCPDSKPGTKDSHLCDTKALIPNGCYTGVFAKTVEFCKKTVPSIQPQC